MSLSEDAPLLRVMREFEVAEAALLGIGGEACVFQLNAHEVLRVNHDGTTRETVERRVNLLAELNLSSEHVPFRIPQVLETLEAHGRILTIETRLPGRPLSQVLAEVSAGQRERLIRALLDCAQQMQELRVSRDWFGDLSEASPIRTTSYHAYLEQRARRCLEMAGSNFGPVDPAQLAAALPEPREPSFVHLDLYPGNVLVDEQQVTAVVDFGTMPLVGDARLDTLSAACYLTPFITRNANDRDSEVAREWLRQEGLHHLLEPARRWIAARWSHATEDVQLHEWCKSVLLDGAAREIREPADRR